MRYKDVACISCGKIFTDESDVVVCPVCGAPHHRDCWVSAGQCAMQAAHESGYSWIFPEEILQARESEARRSAARVRADGTETEIKMRNGENVITCPKCGSANYENDIYCLRCGTRLDGTGTDEENETDETEIPGRAGLFGGFSGDAEQFQAIRNDFDRFGGISPEAPVDGIPCWEYAEFVGGARPGKIIRKVSTMERYGRKFSWMWPALFFGPAWFFWRKMKKEGALLSILLIFLAALFGISQLDSASISYYKNLIGLAKQTVGGEISITEMQEKMFDYAEKYEAAAVETMTPGRAVLLNVLEYVITLALPICCAMIALPLYRKKVKSSVYDVRGQCGNMDEYRRTLSAEGGTSAALALLGILLVLIALFCALYLPLFIVAVFM